MVRLRSGAETHITDALEKGAKAVTGGKRSALGGTFLSRWF